MLGGHLGGFRGGMVKAQTLEPDPGFKSQDSSLSGYVVLGLILHPLSLCYPTCEMG